MKNILKDRKVRGILLIVIGIGVIMSSLYISYLGKSVNQAEMSEFESMVSNQAEAGASPVEESKPSPEGVQQTAKKNAAKPTEPKEIKLGGRTIAILSIPKINLKVAVGEGVDTATLRYFVGHFKGTALPGQRGNFCVAGHRNYVYNEFFSRLDELKSGDEIIVTTLKGTYKYRVNSTKIVPPEETSVLNPTPKPTITLVTCTPKVNPTHRLIVKGELVKS